MQDSHRLELKASLIEKDSIQKFRRIFEVNAQDELGSLLKNAYDILVDYFNLKHYK
jgi:hypothetical protein